MTVTEAPAPPVAVRAAERLPGWAGSIRFRLMVLYSVLLFGLATVVVGGIYAGLAQELRDQDVSRTEEMVRLFQPQEDGPIIGVPVEVEVVDQLAVFEREVNQQALDQLRKYAFGALGLLFIGSLGVGWFVAGLVLRPVGRITSVAREISGTDLSRRIELEGPDDELKQLADTFDDMLGRLDHAFENQREFIHEASHELRNPLAVIRTNLDVVMSDANADEEELRAVGEVVGRSAERMSRLVDDLLTYARHGTRTMRQEDIPPETLAAARASDENKETKISVSAASPAETLRVVARETRKKKGSRPLRAYVDGGSIVRARRSRASARRV